MERWFLRYFHSAATLRGLAQVIAGSTFVGKGIVSVKSVWIDGTPQACGKTDSGKKVKCELADLLYIVQEVDKAGIVQKRYGTLIQAKMAKKFSEIDGGKSTNKERNLLELLDRTMPISLYKDTSGKVPINTVSSSNSYIMSNAPSPSVAHPKIGLMDCARYLLISKFLLSIYPRWSSPFLIGWPDSRVEKYIKAPISVEETITLLHQGALGRKILDSKDVASCDWSRMVWDLLGSYAGILMNTKDSQPRVLQHSECLFFSTGNMEFEFGFRRLREAPPPGGPSMETEHFPAPGISAVVINMQGSGD